MKILLTGATGFVGSALRRQLHGIRNVQLVCAVRRMDALADPRESLFQIEDLSEHTDWSPALNKVDVIVHTAARVHVIKEVRSDPLLEYRRVNVQGTLRLARQAASSGVRRFVFLSTVKVNGEETLPDCPFFAHDEPDPQDGYGQSKLEAEHGLRQIAVRYGMEVVIIRPPLVYGPGVRANFLSLMRAVARGIPLPLGFVDNRRSLVALGNLVDFIIRCIDYPEAANQTFLISDGEDLSTSELVRRLARALGCSPRLLPVPLWLLQAGAALLGRRDIVQRLCGNLQLDISKARQMLNWQPPLTVDEGLRQAVAGWDA